MVGKWLVVLPLFVDFNKVILQPITEESNVRRVRQLNLEDCCPCRDEDAGSVRDGLVNSLSRLDCPCQPRVSDAEASASILLPALRAIQPFVKQADQKSDPKPLLQPEVGLASSVLETLRQATDEEYQDALARDAARSAVKLFEPDISSIGEVLTETPKNVVRIFLNPKDDMDDNLPEPSHVQETRCIHPPLESVHNNGQLKMRRPTPIIEVFNTPRKPNKKPKNKNLFHRNQYEMDNGVGASDIQERVVSPNDDGNLKDIRLKSNPTLFNLFLKNNAVDTDDSQKEDKNPLKEKVIPRTNFKLRDFIDSLDVNSDKEKSKLPVIDLKKYFATTTRLPPLKFKPLEKSIFRNNKPLQLKDLLKLKDVELIPRKELINNKSTLNKSLFSNSNVKSRLSSVNENNDNEKINNCEDGDTNTAPSVNRGIITIGSESTDSGISQTKLAPNFISDKNKYLGNNNKNINRYTIPDECLDLVNYDLNTVSSHSVAVGDQESYDDSDTESDDPNIALINDESDRINSKEDLNNNAMEKESIQKLENNDDIFNDESISNAYEIELLEDLNYPVQFDNSSLTPETDLKKTDETLSNEIQSNQELVNDPIAATSDNDLQIVVQNDDQPTIPQNLLKNTPIECSSYDHSSPVYDINEQNLLPDIKSVEDSHNTDLSNPNQYPDLQKGRRVEDFNDVHERKKSNPVKQKLSDHMEKGTGQVSFKDLQEMSNSLLNLSECGYNENNMNTESFDSENLKEPYDESNEIDDTASSAGTLSLEDSKETKTEDIHDDKVSLTRKSGENEISIIDSNYCKPSLLGENTRDSIEDENEKFEANADTEKSELSGKDSESDSNSISYSNLMSSEPKSSLIRNDINDDDINSNNFTKTDVPDSLQNTELSKILSDIKSKLEIPFSRTEEVGNADVFSGPEDNVNESSNMKPVITNFDESDLNHLQRTPQTLRETLLPNIPGLRLHKNKLAVPKSLDRTINLDPALNSRTGLLNTPNIRKENQREHKRVQYKEPLTLGNPLENIDMLRSTLTSDSKNFLNSPFELSRPFEDTWDPSSAFTDLSDKLRSHTEDAIQNVKETLESRLKESQSGFRRPSDTIDSNDILKSISNRRDEFNEKLQAIHSDINDRFSTFQQSIMDQFNQRPGINSEFEKDNGNTRLRSSNILLKKPSPAIEVSKPRTVPNKQNLKGSLHKSVFDNNESTERFKLAKISKASAASRFQNSDELIPNLNKNIQNLRNGLIFDRHNFPRQQKLPLVSNDDKKLSLQKPVLSATTARPSLPRPKTLKSITDIVPKLNTDTSSNSRQSKIPVVDTKPTKNKFRLQPERNKKLVEQPNSSAFNSLPSRIHQSERTFDTDRVETISSEEDSTASRINKLRKALLQRNPDIKSKGALKIPTSPHLPQSALNNKEVDVGGRTRSSYKTGNLRTNNDDELSPSYIDSRHSAAQNVEDIKLVEPLRENVPYKCKLICYKDS